MARFRFIQWEPQAFLGDTLHLTALQRGLYRDLIDALFLAGGEMPLENDSQMARRLRCKPSEWRKNKAAILPYFRLSNDSPPLITHARISRDLERLETKSKQGKRGAANRWQNEKQLKKLEKTFDSDSKRNAQAPDNKQSRLDSAIGNGKGKGNLYKKGESEGDGKGPFKSATRPAIRPKPRGGVSFYHFPNDLAPGEQRERIKGDGWDQELESFMTACDESPMLSLRLAFALLIDLKAFASNNVTQADCDAIEGRIGQAFHASIDKESPYPYLRKCHDSIVKEINAIALAQMIAGES